MSSGYTIYRGELRAFALVNSDCTMLRVCLVFNVWFRAFFILQGVGGKSNETASWLHRECIGCNTKKLHRLGDSGMHGSCLPRESGFPIDCTTIAIFKDDIIPSRHPSHFLIQVITYLCQMNITPAYATISKIYCWFYSTLRGPTLYFSHSSPQPQLSWTQIIKWPMYRRW